MTKHFACPFCNSTDLKPVGADNRWEGTRIQCQACGAEGPQIKRHMDREVALAWKLWDERAAYCRTLLGGGVASGMGHCISCKWWHSDEGCQSGTCERAGFSSGCKAYALSLAVVVPTKDDHCDDLWTDAMFGCVQWEPREETVGEQA